MARRPEVRALCPGRREADRVSHDTCRHLLVANQAGQDRKPRGIRRGPARRDAGRSPADRRSRPSPRTTSRRARDARRRARRGRKRRDPLPARAGPPWRRGRPRRARPRGSDTARGRSRPRNGSEPGRPALRRRPWCRGFRSARPARAPHRSPGAPGRSRRCSPPNRPSAGGRAGSARLCASSCRPASADSRAHRGAAGREGTGSAHRARIRPGPRARRAAISSEPWDASAPPLPSAHDLRATEKRAHRRGCTRGRVIRVTAGFVSSAGISFLGELGPQRPSR